MAGRNENFSPPRTGVHLLFRGAILHRLDRAVESGVGRFFLGAPGGFGKTVLLSQWLHARRSRVAWLTLEEDDNNEERLVPRILRALAFAERWNRRLGVLARQETVRSWGDLLGVLEVEGPHSKRPATLVVDDFHLLTERASVKFFPPLLRLLPLSFTVCLAGRIPPDPVFEKEILEGEMMVLASSDLAFSKEEIGELIRRRRRVPRNAETIWERTGGWPIAVGAFLLEGLRDRGPGGSSKNLLFHYLEIHIWSSLDEASRDFLAKASLVSSLTPGLCARLAGGRQGETLLENFYQRSFFTTLSHDGTYRMHDLLREFLQHKLEERWSLGERHDLYKALANVFFQERDYYMAASFYVRCSDPGSITECCRALQRYSPHIPLEEQISFTKRYLFRSLDALEEMPPPVTTQCAMVRYMDGDMEGFTHILDALSCGPQDKTGDKKLFAASLRIMDCRSSIEEYLQEELRKEGSGDSLDALWGNRMYVGTMTLFLPFLHRGFVDQTEEISDFETFLEKMQCTCRAFLGDHVALVSLVLRAGTLYEKNALEEAGELVIRAETLTPGVREDLRFCVDMLFLEVLTAAGRPAEARRVEEELLRRIETGGLLALVPNFRAWQYRRRLGSGDPSAGKEWLERYAAPLTEKLAFYKIYQHFTTLRALLGEGSLDLALLFGEKLVQLTKTYRRSLDNLEALLLLSVVHWRRGDRPRALSFLDAVLRRAAAHSLRRFLLEDAETIAPLLDAFVRNHRGEDEDVGRFAVELQVLVHELADSRLEIPGTGRAPDYVLTPRQEEILRLLGENMTYRGMAERLGISESTVKYHVLRLYHLLGVSSAREALRKVRASTRQS